MPDVKPANCPYCEHLLDAARTLESDILPVPGDITICMYCAQPSYFTDDMSLRKPHVGELAQLDRDDKIQIAKMISLSKK